MASGNGDRKDIPERFEWKCDKCSAKGKAASKADAKLALKLHKAMKHGDKL